MEKSIFTPEYTVFLELLREVRQAAGLTQVELAQRLGRSQSFVTKYERGEIRLDIVQIRTVCQTLGTDLRTLIDWYEKKLAAGGERKPKAT